MITSFQKCFQRDLKKIKSSKELQNIAQVIEGAVPPIPRKRGEIWSEFVRRRVT